MEEGALSSGQGLLHAARVPCSPRFVREARWLSGGGGSLGGPVELESRVKDVQCAKGRGRRIAATRSWLLWENWSEKVGGRWGMGGV